MLSGGLAKPMYEAYRKRAAKLGWFAGTPDDLFNQLKAFNQRTGGVGHLLFFGQGGLLAHSDAKENIRLFGRAVAPRLREPGASQTMAGAG